MGVITLNGITSTSIGLQVEIPPNYEIPERVYESIPVPGRNGDIVMDTGAYKNVPRSYEVSIGQENGNFALLANKISGWLHSAPGYLRLEDTYEPDVYKLAKYSEECNITNILQQAGKATLTFDRKPQRFLKSGEAEISIVQAGTTVKNPSIESSKPLIKVTGTGVGKVTVGSYVIDISNVSPYLYIDCDIEDAYRESINMNHVLTLSKGFPVLKSGDTLIKFSGSITDVKIVPRWWKV